jgi:type VI secretion system secreted protein VgrG
MKEPTMKLKNNTFVSAIAVLGLMTLSPGAKGQVITLGTAQNFTIVSSQGVTNSGSSTISGNIALSPLTTITGFTFSSPPGAGVVTGTVHYNDAQAQQAQTDALSAFNALAGLAPSANLTGTDLGGLTLTPGVYVFDSSASLTGSLTLATGTNPDAVFVFQIGSTLTTAVGSSILLTGAGIGTDPNVFWQVGSSATLNSGSVFYGNILAMASDSLGTGARVENGRVMALTGSVTLLGNSIAVVPEPATWAMFFGGMGALGLGNRKRVRRHSST